MQPQLQQNLRNSQNFLHNAALLDALLDNSTVRPGDLVLDLGAGTGAIARRLAERCCRVLAVEQDPSLAARLRRSFPNRSGVQVCQADIRYVPLPCDPYRVFSNIPFDATADIINRLTQARNPPEDAYLVVQRQAAERFVGRPTTTLVSALLAPRFEASVVHRFHRTDFTPIPRVEVVLLRLRKRGPPLLAPSDARAYHDFVVHVFAGRNSSLLHRLALLVGPRCARRLLNDLRIAGCNPAQIPPLQWLQLFTSAMAFAGPELQSRGAEKRLRSHQRTLQKLHRTRQPRLRPPPLRSVAGVRILGEWQWRIRLELTTSTRRTFAARFDWGEAGLRTLAAVVRTLVLVDVLVAAGFAEDVAIASELAERVAALMVDAGLDVLYDDRDVRAGVKFKDADLISIPIRIAIGSRAFPTGTVEWKLTPSASSSAITPKCACTMALHLVVDFFLFQRDHEHSSD